MSGIRDAVPTSKQGHPALLRSDNPAYDSVFTDCLDRIGMDRQDYLRQPTEQLLLPCWVRQLPDCCLLSSNSVTDLRPWKIIQVFICLFLRFDVFVDIKLDHLKQSILPLMMLEISKLYVSKKSLGRSGSFPQFSYKLKCPLPKSICVTQMSCKLGTNRLTKLVREVLGLENLKDVMHMF